MIRVVGERSSLNHVAFTLNFAVRSDPKRNISFCGSRSCLRGKCIAFCSAADRTNLNSDGKRRAHPENDDEKDEEEEKDERKVHFEVQVVSWRERRIKAEVVVDADVNSVWDALTDYEKLADFIPNLVSRYILA